MGESENSWPNSSMFCKGDEALVGHTDKRFVGVRSVRIAGIQMRNAELMRPVEIPSLQLVGALNSFGIVR